MAITKSDLELFREILREEIQLNNVVLGKRFDQIDNNFGQIEDKFKQINEKFEQIDAKFKQIDEKFEQIDERFRQIDKRFEQIDKRFEQIDKRFDDLIMFMFETFPTKEDVENTIDEKLEPIKDDLFVLKDAYIGIRHELDNEHEIRRIHIEENRKDIVMIKEHLQIK